MSKEKKSKSKVGIFFIILIIIAIIAAGAIITKKWLDDKKSTSKVNGEIEPESNNNVVQVEEVKKIQIVDEDSKSRPYAVMINNHHDAWPQCGLQDAYLVYELIAEGGITRMMALYKDQDTAKIGSIRSARDYYIDYAEENDAIFVHWGGSPQAYSRISTRGINDIDGIALEGTVFFRDKTLKRDYEHTGFTSMANVKAYAEKKGFTRDTNKDLLLNYSVDEIDLSNMEGIEAANSINIVYSTYHTTSYEYDAENKVYKRSMSGKANVDLITGEQYTAKNIITYKVTNGTISNDEKGRQELENVGTGTGYFITDGYAAEITWEKDSRSEQTVYKYKSTGEEIVVNDGNTFIQIQPSNQKLTIE